MSSVSNCAGWMIALLLLLPCTTKAEDDRAALDFFERRVRPVLVEHCYECHSGRATALQAGLHLDRASGLRRGGESGPAIKPGRPDDSLLLKAMRWESLEMPPSGKLPQRVIADIETWIRRGAIYPADAEEEENASRTPAPQSNADFWSFKRPRRMTPPAAGDGSAPSDRVDRHILRALQNRGLTPAPEATRRTLVRRLSYDLLGLPPTYEQVRRFLEDSAPGAYQRLVDQMLASPRFGERWGRYWLDVTRYADTGAQNRRFSHAFSYRDWVIDAFNTDLPYDDFIRYQLAADKLQPAVGPHHLAALGMLALGTNLPRATDVPENIDDRIDVVTRGLLGLTVSCARCHDHKFDPIPTEDYYALYGVFLNSHAPLEPVVYQAPSAETNLDAFYQQRLAERRESIDAFRRERLAAHIAEARTAHQIQRYLVAAWDADPPETQS